MRYKLYDMTGRLIAESDTANIFKAINPNRAQVKRRFFQFRRSYVVLDLREPSLSAKAKAYESQHGTSGTRSTYL